jgi:pimeloyl-ACP methyl ester carboxylesterase
MRQESSQRVHLDAASLAEARGRVTHKTVNIDGLDIFYREAGSKDAPTVLLLHGFPTSSQMFRNLIPALAAEYHVVAPD